MLKYATYLQCIYSQTFKKYPDKGHYKPKRMNKVDWHLKSHRKQTCGLVGVFQRGLTPIGRPAMGTDRTILWAGGI